MPSHHNDSSPPLTAADLATPNDISTLKMKTNFSVLIQLLSLKVVDGVAETVWGKPNLNRDIRLQISQIAENPRFGDLYYGGLKKIGFGTVWAQFVYYVGSWRDDDNRAKRMVYYEETNRHQRLLMDVKLDGRNVTAGDEMVEYDW